MAGALLAERGQGTLRPCCLGRVHACLQKKKEEEEERKKEEAERLQQEMEEAEAKRKEEERLQRLAAGCVWATWRVRVPTQMVCMWHCQAC